MALFMRIDSVAEEGTRGRTDLITKENGKAMSCMDTARLSTSAAGDGPESFTTDLEKVFFSNVNNDQMYIYCILTFLIRVLELFSHLFATHCLF